MSSMKVSIIIPVYKVEPYIVRCMESVLRQTYRDLEVILVDDCTPDRSMDLAKECIEASPLSKDLQFVYLKHDHNRGLSAARNTGMDAATGKYIYFLDSDDELPENSMISLVQLVLKYPEIDLVQGNLEVVGNRRNVWRIREYLPEYIAERSLVKRTILNHELFPWPAVNKIYRTSLLRENSLRFRDGIIHEDDHFVFYLAKYAISLAFCRIDTYKYYIRKNSIMTGVGKERDVESAMTIIDDWIDHIDTFEKRAQVKTVFFYLQLHFRYGNYNSLSNIHRMTTKLAKKSCIYQKFLLYLWRYMPMRYKHSPKLLSIVLQSL